MRQQSSIYDEIYINLTSKLFIAELSSSANRLLTLDFLFDINTYNIASIY